MIEIDRPSRLWWSLPLVSIAVIAAGASGASGASGAVEPRPDTRPQIAPSQAAAPEDNVRDLGNGCNVFLGGSNAGFVITDDGIIAIDSTISPAQAKRVRAAIERISDQPVKYLVNTHWHADHTSGNDVFPEATVIYSTAAAKVRLAQDGPGRWKNFSKRNPKDYEGHQLRLPGKTFTEEVTLKLGDREFLVKYLGLGHTDGDCVIVDRRAKVIYAGDLLFQGMHPFMGDGHSKEWVDTLVALEDLCAPDKDDWRLVPGHGEPSPTSLVADMREYIMVLRVEVQKALDAGKTGDELQAAVELPEKFKDLEARARVLPRNITKVASELGP